MLFFKYLNDTCFLAIRIIIIIIIMLAFVLVCVFHLNKFKLFHIHQFFNLEFHESKLLN